MSPRRMQRRRGDHDFRAAADLLQRARGSRDPDMTIAELVAQESSRLGERVLIRRFSRFHIGIA